jgi:Tfp pilus assembly protein PilV
MCIIQNKPGNASVAAMSIKTEKRFRRGVTLVELTVAILVMIISLLGVSSAYVSGRKQIIKQSQYQEAVDLACEKLEDIKAHGYSDLKVDEENEQDLDEDISLLGLTYTRHTSTELTAEPSADVPNPCKKVTVTVQWTGQASDTHEVELITYIGP